MSVGVGVPASAGRVCLPGVARGGVRGGRVRGAAGAGKDVRGGGARRERRLTRRWGLSRAVAQTGAGEAEASGSGSGASSSSSSTSSTSSSPGVYETTLNPGLMREVGVYDQKLIAEYYGKKPMEVARRLSELSAASLKVASVWKMEEGMDPAKRTRATVLRDVISSLGPVFVKLGQTMAARDDLIGSEAADALKTLQKWNPPFDSQTALDIMRENLRAGKRPLAPGMAGEGQPVFAELTAEPIAAASLGQVYRGRTWDGVDVAVKVQRPRLLEIVSLDMHVLRIALVGLRKVWGEGNGVDLRPIADAVGEGLFLELDYLGEARNADRFREEHEFLGFVSSPRWLPEYSSSQVLTMEWVHGKFLSQLEPAQAVLMMQLAVEASVAQLLQTGFVHADPHEGNLIMGDDGLIYFIDFGLMATVDPGVMEAFAGGIVHLLAGNFRELADDFRGMGWVDQFEKLNTSTNVWEPCAIEEFCSTLEGALTSGSGVNADTGLVETARQGFGDLLEVFAKLSSNYKFICPPYAILLGRTFATLEGICAKADPDFNVYEAALPYAVRRGLAPTTPHGASSLRATLLTERGSFQWARFQATLAMADMGDRPTRGTATDPVGVVAGVLAAPEGRVLRGILADVDTVDIVRHIAGKQGKVMRDSTVQAMSKQMEESLSCPWLPGRKKEIDEARDKAAINRFVAREYWQKRVVGSLLSAHVRRLFSSSEGLLAAAMLLMTTVKVFFKAFLFVLGSPLRALFPARDRLAITTPKPA